MPKAYELPAPGQPFDPALFKLGVPCKRNHIHANGLTLRKRKGGACILCTRIDDRERQNRLRQDPDFRAAKAAARRQKHQREGRPSRSKHGLPYTPRPDQETRLMKKAIRQAGRLPSVAQLVRDQQYEHWRTHPDDRKAYLRERARLQSRWAFMTNPKHCLYHRAKSKARKVAQRGGQPLHLSASHLWRHWSRFGHCCAYCKRQGDLEVEHVVPISKGGQHHLGNIVPACQSCNSSKRTKDAHDWFKDQPFYSEQRWQRIVSVLQAAHPRVQQGSLLDLIP
jgi:5-methylcytosine-specific restriction endonuclease McrA